MRIAGAFLLLTGTFMMINKSNGLLGLHYRTEFSNSFGELLTDVFIALDNLNAVVAKTQVQCNILLIAETQHTRNVLVDLHGVFETFKSTHTQIRTSFLETNLDPGSVSMTADLSVRTFDNMLPTFEKLITDIEAFTSVEMFNHFPNEHLQSDLKHAFQNIFLAVNRVAYNNEVLKQDDVDSVVSVEDQKTVLDYYTIYLQAIKEVTEQFNIILKKFTTLSSFQIDLIIASAPSYSSSSAWFANVLEVIGSTPLPLIGALVPELQHTNSIVSSVSKSVFSKNHDSAIVCVEKFHTNIVAELKSTINKVTVLHDTINERIDEYEACVAAGI